MAITMASVWGVVWPILIAIFLFVIIIISHEFGHFIAAKLLGVKVNEFAVGFGPKLFSRLRGETVYSLRAVPFGGFCAMEGEDEESDNPRAFNNKKPWRRFIIVAAGACFNFILGFLIALIIMSMQPVFTTTTVGGFYDTSVSNQYLKEGDDILEVDGRNVYTTADLQYILGTNTTGVFDFVVRRDGERITLNDVTFQTREVDGRSTIVLDFKVYGEKKTVFTTIKQSFLTTVSYGRIVFMSLFDLITGKFGLSDLSGPVGVTAAISQAAKNSFEDLLGIACLITVNLGVMNLLPLPALDGGRLLFILVEMIRRKPVPPKYEGIVHTVGFLLLIGLMLFVTANDIWNLIRG